MIHVLPNRRADGSTQMAADEWMLSAALDGVPHLRFYTWEPATLSLGYFQNHADRSTDPRLAELPMVRRQSGGGAIVHHHDLTYSFALPPQAASRAGGESWVCRFHHAVLDAIAQLGIPANARGCGEERGKGSFLCFEHHTPGDLLIGPHKVVGSAQRRPRGALLQHGSILLSASEYAPQLPGIRDLAGSGFTPDELSTVILEALETREGWRIERCDWPSGSRSAIAAIAAEKYSRPEWNRKR